jgi:ferric-chelate reductase
MSGLRSFAGPSVRDGLLFVTDINILLFCLFGLYVASTLPRALVRLFHPSEFLNGVFLRSAASSAERGKNARRFGPSGGITNTDLVRSTSAASDYSARTLLSMREDDKGVETFKPLVTPRARGPQRPPPRVPRWTTVVHPALAYMLNLRVFPGFSFGKLLVLFIYSIVMLYACLFRSDPFTDPVRTGYVAVSQIPIAMALAGKANCLSWLCGVGYDKVYTNRASLPSLFFSKSSS